MNYDQIWKLATPLLKKGRPDDYTHAQETVKSLENYQGELDLDLEVLIPAAIMHDIGHSAILPEHFKHVTGPDKLVNGKLVHMLSGAKIAKNILEQVNYNPKKSAEIVEIISIHDFDQLDIKNWADYYDTEQKKIFHDFDSLDRYTLTRINNIKDKYKNLDKLLVMLEKLTNNFFFDEFRELALNNLEKLKKDAGKNQS